MDRFCVPISASNALADGISREERIFNEHELAAMIGLSWPPPAPRRRTRAGRTNFDAHWSEELVAWVRRMARTEYELGSLRVPPLCRRPGWRPGVDLAPPAEPMLVELLDPIEADLEQPTDDEGEGDTPKKKEETLPSRRQEAPQLGNQVRVC